MFRSVYVIFYFYLATCNYIYLFTDIFELEVVSYTNESLDILYKKDLIPIVLSLQNKLDEARNSKTELLDEIRKLNDKFGKLQSDVCVCVCVCVLQKMLTTYFQVDSSILNVNAGQMPSILGRMPRYCRYS